MRRRIAGSEADHRKRGFGIVAELPVRRRPRPALTERLGALLTTVLALYFGKRS